MTLGSPAVPNDVDETPDHAGLVVEGLTVRYGDAIADNAVTVSVAPGEIVALLGANGAGKSSLLNAISGTVPAECGELTAGGVSLNPLPPQERAHLVAQVPEGRRLFPNHTVRENLTLAAFGAGSAERRARLEEVLEVLPQLRGLLSRRADLLSGGEQQMVALGRGLMSKAPILMVDELSLGLAPTVAQRFARTLLALKEQGYAILLVEQYVALAMEVADRVVLLDHGTVVLEGSADEVRDEVMALEEAYLGGHDPEFERATDDTPALESLPFNLPRPTLLTGAATLGAVFLTVSLFLPWFGLSGTTTSTLRGVDVPAPWIWIPLALALVVLVCSLARLSPDRWPLARSHPVLLGAVAGTCGLAVFVLLFARCWILSGLGSPGDSVQRDWGIFVAFAIAGPYIAGAGLAQFVSQLFVRRRLTPSDPAFVGGELP